MKNLERLDLLDCELTRRDLLSVFRSCSELMELRIKTYRSSATSKTVGPMNQEEYNELQLARKRLRLFDVKEIMEHLRLVKYKITMSNYYKNKLTVNEISEIWWIKGIYA